jgi:hypothetical protein
MHDVSDRLMLEADEHSVQILLALVQVSPAGAATARNQETPNSDPYIQELLRKTEEQRDARAQARLQDYYKRNFQVHPPGFRRRGLPIVASLSLRSLFEA